jgi:signal peptidase II
MSIWYMCVLSAGLFLFDRCTKVWALHNLFKPLLINDYISFELVLNRGVSWGVFHSAGCWGHVLLMILIVCVLIVLGVMIVRLQISGRQYMGPMIAFVGGFSNFVDRVAYGAVVDFVALSFGSWHFPVFNVADVLVYIGIFIVMLHNLRKT